MDDLQGEIAMYRKYAQACLDIGYLDGFHRSQKNIEIIESIFQQTRRARVWKKLKWILLMSLWKAQYRCLFLPGHPGYYRALNSSGMKE